MSGPSAVPTGPRGPAPRESTQRESIPFKTAQAICRVFTSVYFDLKVWGIEHVPRPLAAVDLTAQLSMPEAEPAPEPPVPAAGEDGEVVS